MSEIRLLILALLLASAPPIALAHHSTTEFDRSGVVEIDGEVIDVFWRNPHVMIKVATESSGLREIWTLEGSSVSGLQRRGLTRVVLKVGDTIKAAGYASTRTDNRMLVFNVLLPNGDELLVRNNSEPRFTKAAKQTGPVLFDAASIEDAKASAEGLFRVWTWGRAGRDWWFHGGPERFPLTAAALASLDRYDEHTDNPALKCIAPGMPATMGNPYPMEFARVGNTIEYRSEEFDIVRTIHMDAGAEIDAAPSPLGHSVGHWEDDHTLVVRTSRIDTPYFNRVGVRQSADVVVDERFILADDGNRLDYEIRVTDPATLTVPWEWGAHWVWAPGEEVGRYECAVAD